MPYDDPLGFRAFSAEGLDVRGVHSPDSLPVYPDFTTRFAQRHALWKERVLTSPGGHDSPRVALTAFTSDQAGIQLRTATRSYTEGGALADCVADHLRQGTQALERSAWMQPQEEVSWGLSVSSYVLLPHGYALCSQRGSAMATDPGRWTFSNSEVVIPEDVNDKSMAPLLNRHTRDELPSLEELGTHKFVGLGVRSRTYAWQLVAVHDLRCVSLLALTAALDKLGVGPQAQAWAVCEVNSLGSEAPFWAPAGVRPCRQSAPADLQLVRYLMDSVHP